MAPALCATALSHGFLAWPLAVQVAVQSVLSATVVVLIAHGADWLVDSACRIASVLGVSHLIIGLTVVAVGTSAPEIAASLHAGFGGRGDVAVANVVGSNVFNLCFILGGVSLLLRNGLATERSLVFRDGPMLLLGTALLYIFVGELPGHSEPPALFSGSPLQPFNRRLERAEGGLLLGILAIYLAGLYRGRHAHAPDSADLPPGEPGALGVFRPRDVPIFIGGLLLVVLGCRLLVGQGAVGAQGVHGYGAIWFARVCGVPDYVVGVTIVAAGTSAPELVVSLVAAVKRQFGLSAGNLIGSDIFNFYGVLGLCGVLLQPPLAAPVAVSPSLNLGVLAPCGVVLVVLLFMRTQMRISRTEGAMLLLLGMARWANDLAVP